MIKIIKPSDFKDYELLDSGHFYKLERYGNYILSRPEPQAVWPKSLSEKEWDAKLTARFERDKANSESGIWTLKKDMPEQWKIKYDYNAMKLVFRLGMTAFKHIGIFPEQAENWNYIYEKTSSIQKHTKPKILNLFAYTGGASLASNMAGAEVTHVDSIKQTVNWANENRELSSLKDIRWVVEDAMKFVKREVKRGSVYHGIILDPPAYGRGPDREKWVLETDIDEMIQCCSKLLHPEHNFFILNLYAMGFSSLVAETLINYYFKNILHPEMGELYLEDQFTKKLPLSVFYRFSSY